jgi:hypothetical protein
MKTRLQSPRGSQHRSRRLDGTRSAVAIFGRHFAVVWRGRGWELVSVVALLIVALAVWLKLK